MEEQAGVGWGAWQAQVAFHPRMKFSVVLSLGEQQPLSLGYQQFF